MSKDIAFEFSEYAVNLKISNMPDSAIEATKVNIYDSLSCGIAGSAAIGVKELLQLAEMWGGNPQATTFAFGKRIPAPLAAMINTVQIHGFDYDDNHDTAMLHSGAVVCGAAFAAAERMGGVPGADLLAGIAAGLDIHCRLGLAATVGIVESGFIYTALMGGFAAVAAAGRIMGLTEEQMVNAFGTVLSMAAGTYMTVTDSAQTKALQAGFASKAAIEACEIAKLGIRGVQNTFEGVQGFYQTYLNGKYNPDVLRKDLGLFFAQEGMGYKPWPCGRPNHPPINACLEAREKYNPKPEEIKRVELGMNEHLYRASIYPVEVRKHPKTVLEGRFSIPYNCACAFVNGKVGLMDYTEKSIQREEILSLAEKIDGVIDQEIEKNYRARVCPIRVKIEMKDGRVFEHYMEKTLGSPEKPMTEEIIRAKIEDCMEMSAVPHEKDLPEKLKNAIYNIETLQNSNTIIALMKAKK